jgi:hypothetical protein
LIVSAIFHYYEGETKTPENILQKGIENSDNRNALFAVKELLERKYCKPLLHDCRKTNWRQSSVHVSSQVGGMYLNSDIEISRKDAKARRMKGKKNMLLQKFSKHFTNSVNSPLQKFLKTTLRLCDFA